MLPTCSSHLTSTKCVKCLALSQNLMHYNRKWNVLSASLKKPFPSYHRVFSLTLLNIFCGSCPVSMAQARVDFRSMPPTLSSLASAFRAESPASAVKTQSQTSVNSILWKIFFKPQPVLAFKPGLLGVFHILNNIVHYMKHLKNTNDEGPFW